MSLTPLRTGRLASKINVGFGSCMSLTSTHHCFHSLTRPVTIEGSDLKLWQWNDVLMWPEVDWKARILCWSVAHISGGFPPPV